VNRNEIRLRSLVFFGEAITNKTHYAHSNALFALADMSVGINPFDEDPDDDDEFMGVPYETITLDAAVSILDGLRENHPKVIAAFERFSERARQESIKMGQAQMRANRENMTEDEWSAWVD
jgi:hypothetical protein